MTSEFAIIVQEIRMRVSSIGMLYTPKLSGGGEGNIPVTTPHSRVNTRN